MVIELGGEVKISISDVVKVARQYEKVTISSKARDLINSSHDVLSRLVSSNVKIYGVNTGLGELYNISVNPSEVAEKSVELLIDHAAGVGDPAPDDWVRGAIMIRAHQLSKGFSGVREEVIDSMISLLNLNITPIVPKFGSVGASGDLAPLAHIALALLGVGNVKFRGKIVDAHYALKEAGMSELKLSYKEALALINGNSYSASVAMLGLWDSLMLVESATVAMVMTIEASGSNISYLKSVINPIRLHHGEKHVADLISRAIRGVNFTFNRLQDPYSLRCIPQVLGSVLDLINWAVGMVTDESNSVSDNPILFNGEALSTCYFHGQYIALSIDSVNIALSVLGNLIERQIMQLMRREINGVGNYLVNGPWRVGLMLTQYTAAALAGRLRELATPSTVHNIPTSGLQEDVNSMSANSAIKLHDVNDVLSRLIALLAYVSYMVLKVKNDCRECGEVTRAAYSMIDKAIDGENIINNIVNAIRGILPNLAHLLE
ncbi:aromatic amino acid ammonia-lyase [Caldivirga sp.]|uniref:aromatic amino acid ammonia-lyase n=1 Tax=Caldivirga sp. TaxID=2080243 RepID=UPI0025B8D387|nr:aromatic amino acid ammonia-lyase [Caldivirga sp.]